MITPEQARAELQRRKQGGTTTPVATSSVTPEQARAELEKRRKAQDNIAGDFKKRTDKGADIIVKSWDGKRSNLEASLGVLGQGAGFIGDLTGRAISAVTPDPIGELALKPIRAVAQSRFGQAIGRNYMALPERARENIEAVGNIATIVPIAKGAQVAAQGATKATTATVGAGARATTAVGRDLLGKTTGVGGGTLSAGFGAVRKSPESAQVFTKALRGEFAPEQIVQEAKDALGKIKQARTDDYVTRLNTLKQSKETLDVSPVVKEVDTQLNKFGVVKTPEGLDFSRSALRFDKKAQDEIQTIVNEMSNFGLRQGDRTVIGVDSLKRALGDLYSDSSSARAFTQAVKSKTSDILKKINGYEDLVNNYAKSTELIDEVSKSLSLGDKAMIDTGFRKLTSALRTNNEARKQLIDELDKIAGSQLTAKIAGQQLSEKLPRGLSGTLTGIGTVGAGLSGVSIPLLLAAGLTTSPRVIGEFIKGLGYSARQVDKIIDYFRKTSSSRSAANLNTANISTNNINSRINSIPQSLPPRGNVSSELSTPTLSDELINASVASKLPPRTVERMKPNFTPELNKNIAEIIDVQRGVKKVSPQKAIELEADMTSIIEDFGFAIPSTKAARIRLLERIYNKEI